MMRSFAGKLSVCGGSALWVRLLPVLLSPLLLLTASIFLSSCGVDAEYRLRFWEKYRIAAEHALRRKQYRFAHTMALEAVEQARSFGRDDYRLGVSLCDLADVEKAQLKSKQAESSYKSAIKVLEHNTAADAGSKQPDRGTEFIIDVLAREGLANCFYQLADLYSDEKRFADAAECFSQAAKSYRSILGAGSWDVDDCPLGQKLVAALIGLAKSELALNNLAATDDAYHAALQIAMASNYPEFSLRDLRNDYLLLAKKIGKEQLANQLQADSDWENYSSAGMKAYYAKDFATATPLLNHAFQAAQSSIFSARRVLKSLRNLAAVYSASQDFPQLEQVCVVADRLMQTGKYRFDNDYDDILSCEATLYNLTGRPEQAIASLNIQIKYRRRFYGQNSIEVCQSLVSKGLAELKLGARNYAAEAADFSFKILREKFWSNRRAMGAMLDTSSLYTDLGQFDKAEQLQLQVLDLQKKRLEKTDARLISHEAAAFVFYAKFNKHDQAMKIAQEVKGIYRSGSSAQRVCGFPYLVLMLSFSMVNNWIDIAELLANTGNAVLQKEMQLSTASETEQYNWTKDIARLEALTGKKFH